MEKNIVDTNATTNTESMANLLDASPLRPYASNLNDENDTMESIAPDAMRSALEILTEKRENTNALIAAEVKKNIDIVRNKIREEAINSEDIYYMTSVISGLTAQVNCHDVDLDWDSSLSPKSITYSLAYVQFHHAFFHLMEQEGFRPATVTNGDIVFELMV